MLAFRPCTHLCSAWTLPNVSRPILGSRHVKSFRSGLFCQLLRLNLGGAKLQGVSQDLCKYLSCPVCGGFNKSVAVFAGKVTNKADMFSFGVLLWEIITVERPVRRGNLRDIMYAFTSLHFRSCQQVLDRQLCMHNGCSLFEWRGCKRPVAPCHQHVDLMPYLAALGSGRDPRDRCGLLHH